ncbi:MAG: PAS domain S-box protein [Bacillota bacterium]
MRSSRAIGLFQELVDLIEVQRLQADFSAATGLATSILDPDGQVLTKSGWTDLCTVFHRGTPAAAARCRESDRRILAEAARNRGEVIQNCANGLVMAATPIVVAGRHLATIILSQVFFESPDEDRFRSQARMLGLEEEPYLEAVRRIPVLTKKEFLLKIRFIGNLAGLISTQGQRNWEQKALEDELRRERVHLQAVFQGSGSGMRIIGTDYRIVEQNQEMERLSGVPGREAVGQKCFQSFHHACCGTADCILHRILAGEERVRLEVEKTRPDGQRVDVSLIATPLKNPSGKITGVIESFEDITERKLMEERLRTSQNVLNLVFNNVYDAIFIHASDGRIIDVNRKMLEMYGVERDEALTLSIRDDFSGPDNPLDQLPRIWERVLAGESELFEWQARRPIDGSVFDVEVFLCRLVLNGDEVVLATVRDITERKRSQKALQESHEELETANEELVAVNEELVAVEEELRQQMAALEQSREALEAANRRLADIIEFFPDATFVVNRKRKVVAWNRALEELTGVPKADIIGRGVQVCAEAFYGVRRPLLTDLIIGRGGRDLEKRYDYVERRGNTLYAEVFIPMVKNGRGAHVWKTASPLFDQAGRLVGAIESIRDISDLKRAQEEIRTQKAYFEQLFENSPLAIVMLDDRDRIISTNRGFQSLFQYSAAEVAGRPIDRLITPPERSDEGATFTCFVREGETVQAETVRRRKDGSLVEVSALGFPIVLDNQLAGAYAIYDDIAVRKQAQAALLESEGRLKTVLDSIQSGVVVIDAQTHQIVSANRVAAGMVGCPAEDIVGSVCHQFICPAEKGACPITDFGQSIDCSERVLLRANGEIVSIIKNVAPVFFNGRKHLIESFVDITARKQAEEELTKAKALLDGVLDAIPDVVGVQDSDHRIIRLNQAGYRLFNLTPRQVKGKKCYELIGRSSRCRPCATEKAWRTKRLERVEKFVPELGRYLDCRSNPVLDENGNTIMVVEQFYDVTERRLMEERLRHLSLHDPLTGLYNRYYFEQELRRAEGTRQVPIGVIVCDVDGLKLVNDTLGHDAGDALLVATAAVLKQSFRQGDMIARVGGDEFAVLLPGSGLEIVEEAGDRIREAVANYNSTKPEMALSISVGFAVADESPVNVKELFREADNNMYRVKLHHSRSARSAIVQTLMKALEARDFITEGHADRLQTLVVAMAAALEQNERIMTDLRLLAQFHDLGKVGIPDRILFKAGPLTSEEVAEMRRHSEIGHRIALSAPDLAPIADWILKHHEWWNGGGYPLGLKEEEIPLECRILAIADAYDAMTNDRPYRKAMSHQDAVAELKAYAGIQFDPSLVEVFLKLFDRPAPPPDPA